MKNRASTFLKQVFSAVVTIVKAKSLAVKSKTSAMKSRLLIFGLLRNKKYLMSVINHKIHALMGQEKWEDDQSTEVEDSSKALVLFHEGRNETQQSYNLAEQGEGGTDDYYPDLRHSLFNLDDDDNNDQNDDDDDDCSNATGSVIDLVKNSKQVDGSEFSLEDEIDHVADVFIKRFHKQMKMQKLESFKRYQEMMERSL